MRSLVCLSLLVGACREEVDAPATEPFVPAEQLMLAETALVEDTCALWSGGNEVALPVADEFLARPDETPVLRQANFEMECALGGRELVCGPLDRTFPQNGVDAIIVQRHGFDGSFEESGDLVGIDTWEIFCTGADCDQMQSNPPIPCIQSVEVRYAP